MVFTNAGKNVIRDFLGGVAATAPTHFAVGDDNTDESSDDTVLANELARKVFESTDTGAERKISFEGLVDSTEQNGQTLKEFGLFNASTSGTLFTRITHAGLEKSSSIDVQYVIEIEVE